MKKLFTVSLMLLTLILTPITCQSTEIDVKGHETISHGGARMPSSTQVAADYEGGVITVDITRYTGSVHVYVYDTNDKVVGYTVSTISGSGSVALDTGILPEGDYTLYIVLGNTTYSGEFKL